METYGLEGATNDTFGTIGYEDAIVIENRDTAIMMRDKKLEEQDQRIEEQSKSLYESARALKAEHNGAMPNKEDYTTSNVTVTNYGSTNKESANPAFEEVETAAKTLENEAMRVVKLSNGNWTPGEHKGNKVRARYHIPITFRLN